MYELDLRDWPELHKKRDGFPDTFTAGYAQRYVDMQEAGLDEIMRKAEQLDKILKGVRVFPKAKFFEIKRARPVRIAGKWRLKPLYARMSNGACLYIPFFWLRLCWRMPWLPVAAYEMGWNAAWRQCNGLGHLNGQKADK
jgi:hypothetical protein